MNDVLALAARSRAAAARLATLTRAAKDRALHAIADALDRAHPELLAANARDVAGATAGGAEAGTIDRLTLTAARLHDVANAVRTVIALPDPVGDVVRGYVRPNGLEIREVRVPLGVVGIIYEARPNVTVDAAALCLKSGNAVLLRGSASAHASNEALVAVLRGALADTDVPVDAVALVPGTGHDAVRALMNARGLVDVLIPRGGADLIRTVAEGATVPVIETGVGNCHVYVDADADLEKAIEIVVNAKTQRVSVCNAAETLLVHRDVADALVPRLLATLRERGVTIHGDAAVAPYATAAGIPFVPATDADWAKEYLSLDLAVAIVSSIDEAIAHVRRWSTGHTEAIVTDSQGAARRFVAEIDAAAVMVNASTRFTDGGEFGFGAEIGISTQKLHARGPMGLRELTTSRYVVTGNGHVRT